MRYQPQSTPLMFNTFVCSRRFSIFKAKPRVQLLPNPKSNRTTCPPRRELLPATNRESSCNRTAEPAISRSLIINDATRPRVLIGECTKLPRINRLIGWLERERRTLRVNSLALWLTTRSRPISRNALQFGPRGRK